MIQWEKWWAHLQRKPCVLLGVEDHPVASSQIFMYAWHWWFGVLQKNLMLRARQTCAMYISCNFHMAWSRCFHRSGRPWSNCPGATFVVGADVLTRRSKRIRHFRTDYNSCLAGLATWSCEGPVGNLPADAMNQNSNSLGSHSLIIKMEKSC